MVDLGGYVIVLVEQKGKIKILGCAAEKNDYDEILEINGKLLENSTHQEIVDHIHSCIKSRTISLRVKRRTSGKKPFTDKDVTVDAFIIGSRAREHLQRLTHDSDITPRDIAQLSRILCETGEIEDLKTSLKELPTEAATKSDIKSCPPDKTLQATSTSTTFKITPSESSANVYLDTSKKQSDSANKGFIKSESSEADIEYYELSDENMELVELNTKNLTTGRVHHREVPVDVPESFVGIVKQHPRYPPPASSTTTDGTLITSKKAKSSAPPLSKTESEKLRKYSDDITKRKAEQDFLRNSLRGSKKLHQLEKKKSDQSNPCSAINNAFEGDDDASESNKALPYVDLNPILDRVTEKLSDDLKELISKTNLKKLIAIYNSVMQQKQKHYSLTSSQTSASDLMQEIILMLQQNPSSEAAELLELLTRFELEGLCYAFDKIITTVRDLKITPNQSDQNGNHKEGEKLLSEEHINSDSDQCVRLVRIEKSSCEPLGATVRNESDGSVIIGRIIKGGAAEKSGLLHEGDEILEVNGIELKGRNVNQVCDLLADMTGTLSFVVATRDHQSITQPDGPHKIVHMKALFDYDPEDDNYIPCRELGICFSKGDILHVIEQSDPNWWQAYRDGEQDQSLAGLIPSHAFQLQRESIQHSMLLDGNNTASQNYRNRTNKKCSASSLLFNCGKGSHGRRKKSKKYNMIPGVDEISTFEEVSLYYPRANIKRPIILIGPTNIGRHEIRQKLMLDTERFAAAVPHTSRPRRDGEINGVDYHFISRQAFEQDIKDGKFVEHGQFEKNYYGTSLAAIEAVVQSGKICVLNMHVQSIPILRQGHAGAKLKPYFVFVAPPTQVDRLRKLISTTHLGQECHNISPSEIQSIIDEARDIETRFGHYFDKVLPITDIDRAYQELIREINSLEREPQWIPKSWTRG